MIEYLLRAITYNLALILFKRINRVKLITLTDKDGKVISYKVTKKIDDETRIALKVFGITAIKAEKMYW